MTPPRYHTSQDVLPRTLTFTQLLSLHLMAELARRNGVNFNDGSSLEWQLEAYYKNPLKRLLVSDEKEVLMNSFVSRDEFVNSPVQSADLKRYLRQFDKMTLAPHWRVWSKSEFIGQITESAENLEAFAPAGLGVQVNGNETDLIFEIHAWMKSAGLHDFVFPQMGQFELQHYERQLQGFKYASDLYPEWGWLMRSIFYQLDTKRPSLYGNSGFSVFKGQAN